MKRRLRKITAAYFNSWWMPSAISLALLIIFTVTALPRWRWITIISNVIFVCLAISFLGILAAGVWNLVKKQWARGTANLVLLLVCGGASFVAMGFLMFASMFGPSEDGFADNLSIPTDVEVTEPIREFEAAPGKAEDAFQRSLLTSLASAGNDDPTITADVSKLVKLYRTSPATLMRFLAASPSWRVFRERGNVFATRRWMIGPGWRYSLHGYYTKYDVGARPGPSTPYFQSRLTLGFSGKPWARASWNATQMHPGQTRALKLSIGNRMYESRCIINAEGLVVEVFEQSEAKERRLTKAALSHVEKELGPLVTRPGWKTVRSILPAGSIRQGDPVFELSDSLQPGIYDSEIWLNPGEPGMIYLKAYEVTGGTPLSVDRLKERSNEWIGWSDDPKELFFSNTIFTIYEGDWGKPYAARFEIWFAPDSGANDRKLMEKVFKIEGWQR
jgi:hypothetical protein